MPMHTGQVCVFGGAPNFVLQPQKSFDSVESWTWVSRPTMRSYAWSGIDIFPHYRVDVLEGNSLDIHFTSGSNGRRGCGSLVGIHCGLFSRIKQAAKPTISTATRTQSVLFASQCFLTFVPVVRSFSTSQRLWMWAASCANPLPAGTSPRRGACVLRRRGGIASAGRWAGRAALN